jgi:dihydrolipoamide dehydrogenase
VVVGEFTQETDLVIIGGGPAGYTAAFRAAALGVQTVIVDSRPGGAGSLGGVCLHQGCVPSKTLLHIAETVYAAENASQFGLSFNKPQVDFAAVRAWKEKTIAKLAAGLESQAKKHGVECLTGEAQFEDAKHIVARTDDAGQQRIKFKRALIATGSVHVPHPNLPLNGTTIITPQESMSLESLPKSLLIVGGDYMAIELAMIFSALGSQVTIASETEELLSSADRDLVRPLIKNLERRLAALQLGAKIKTADIAKSKITINFDGDQSKPLKIDQVIVSGAQVGNTRGLHLEKTQVKINEHEFITVDQQMRSSDPRILAAGDVTGVPLLADKALHQGRIAAEVIAGQDSIFDARTIPVAIFSDPQIAWCGLTENEAKTSEMNHEIAKMPWGASGRAAGMGRSEGITKVIFDPESKLVLGIGMVGYGACEMISEGALAIEMGATLTDLAATIHPHPTMSELVSDAARSRE